MSKHLSNGRRIVFSLSIRDVDIPVTVLAIYLGLAVYAVAQFMILFSFGNFSQTVSKIDAARELIKAPQNRRFDINGR